MVVWSWQDELVQQVEEGLVWLWEMFLVGLGFLCIELGFDLGLELKWYFGWVILVGIGVFGLLLLFLLGYGWVVVCVGVCKKWRSLFCKWEEVVVVLVVVFDDLVLLKNFWSEEQKKKNWKKLFEKFKLNGWIVEVVEGEVV